MTLLLIILAVLVIGISVAFFAMKKGMIEDKDGNNIPDVIDVKIEETKETVNAVDVSANKMASSLSLETVSQLLGYLSSMQNDLAAIRANTKADSYASPVRLS